MGLVMLPKTLGKGIPCASQRTFPNAFPMLPPVWDQRLKAPMWASPKSVFLFWGTGNYVALSSFVCLGDILHTFAQAPAVLVLLGAAVGSSCLPVQQPTRGPTPGLGLASSQRPPEGLKSNPDSGPWTPVFVMDLCAGRGNEKGRTRQGAASLKLKCSPEL